MKKIIIALCCIVALSCNKNIKDSNITIINNGGNVDSSRIAPADSVLSISIGQVTLSSTDINGNATNTIQQRRVLQTTVASITGFSYAFYGTCTAEIVVEIRDYATNTTLISRAYGVNVPTPIGTLQMGTPIPKGLYIISITINVINKTARSWVYPFQVY